MRPVVNRRYLAVVVISGVAALTPSIAGAQDRPAVEVTGGWAGFVDDGTIHHSVVGAGLRVPISPRVSVTPEAVYMIGPDADRDWMITGNLVFDFTPAGRVRPYLLAGGGLFHHTEDQEFWERPVSTTEGAFTGGGGVRIWLNRSVYLAPEWRLGWELHQRLTVGVGIQM